MTKRHTTLKYSVEKNHTQNNIPVNRVFWLLQENSITLVVHKYRYDNRNGNNSNEGNLEIGSQVFHSISLWAHVDRVD